MKNLKEEMDYVFYYLTSKNDEVIVHWGYYIRPQNTKVMKQLRSKLNNSKGEIKAIGIRSRYEGEIINKETFGSLI